MLQRSLKEKGIRVIMDSAIFNSIWEGWKVIAPVLSIPLLAFLTIFVLIYTHPEPTRKWVSLILKLIAWRSLRAEQAYIDLDIRSRINSCSKAISSEVGEIMPYGIKIEWVKETTPQAFLDKNEIIVKMKYHTNQDRNRLTSVMAYASRGIIPHARPYIDKEIIKSIDFVCVRKVLISGKRTTAIDLFLEDTLGPTLQKQPKIRKYYKIMETLDDQGFFTRILLREFVELGRRMYAHVPNESLFRETGNFVEFLNTIVTREFGEIVPLDFRGEKIKVNVILVGRPEVRDVYGASAYIRRVQECVRKQTDVIYLCSWGDHNNSVAREIAEPFKDHSKVEEVIPSEYGAFCKDRGYVKAVCIMFRTTFGHSATPELIKNGPTPEQNGTKRDGSTMHV